MTAISLGEYAALVTAGVLTLEDGLKLVARRAGLMVEKCAPSETAMLAVKMNATRLEHLIEKETRYIGLSIACYNRYVYSSYCWRKMLMRTI